MSNFEPLHVAIVGCGNISRAYGSSIRSNPDKAVIVGAYDIDLDRSKNYVNEFGGRAYETLDHVLADDQVEVIVNLTVHSVHADVSIATMEAGKHVHSEKPLATNREDGKRQLEIADRNGVRLSCSPFTFLGEAQQTAWRAIRDGEIGKVLIAYAEMNWGRIESWHPNPVPFYQKGVGPMLDVGVYALTVLTTILGPVKSVRGDARILLPNRKTKNGENYTVTTPDQITGFLDFESGSISRMTASFLGYSRQGGIEFHGEKGTIFLSSSHDFNASVELHTTTHGWEKVPYVSDPFPGVEWGRAIFQLAESIRIGSPQRVTGKQAYHVLDICLSILDSAEQNGRSIELNSTFDPPDPS